MTPVSHSVIEVDRLSKLYRIHHRLGGNEGFRHRLQGLALTPLQWLRGRTGDVGPDAPADEDFWALRDISFRASQGTVVGVVGRNGAGKSTLLKILSRITDPTEGSARIRGRVSSLLEVGTGFHPELTGRENVFVNGALLGMTRADILRRFDEIVEFAGVERFLDTPVKRYSSGMQLRLAFAVAAHLEPEILIVDEVLAVGDLEFQKKCLGKMKDVAAGQGRTILFVSHNLAALQALCSEAIYLREGRLVGHGPADAVIARYASDTLHEQDHASGGRRALSAWLACESLGCTPNPVRSGERLRFFVELSATGPAVLKELSLEFYSGFGTKVANIDLRSHTLDYAFGGDRRIRLEGHIASLNLVEGNYSVGIYITCGDVTGHFADLSVVTVLQRPDTSGIAPYAAYDRGYVELDVDFGRAAEPAMREPSGAATRV
jgi:ABC-type polysaccharide/polyol phosphate transport system ATPase subunit